jgi:hypothetical protein
VLSVEHRAAASPIPSGLRLVKDDGPLRLELREISAPRPPVPLADRILQLLAERGPLWQEDLRKILRVRKQDLTVACRELESSHRAGRTPKGWAAMNGR